MIIDGSIAGYYLPGPFQPQDQPRPYQNPPAEVERTLEVKPVSKVPDPEAYEKLRRRLEEEERPAIQREGLSSKARRALTAYGDVEQSEIRDYATQVLGLDVFA
jgi:hypothetical protein